MVSYSWARKNTCSTVYLDEIQTQTVNDRSKRQTGKNKAPVAVPQLYTVNTVKAVQYHHFNFSGPTYLNIVAANGVIAGASVQGGILPGDLSDQEAVHFGSMALKDTNALPTLKSAQTRLALAEIEGSPNTFPQQKDA